MPDRKPVLGDESGSELECVAPRLPASRRASPTTGLYIPGPVTAGRALYEKWLWAKWVSPDDLWDGLSEEDRHAWEAIA